MFLFKNILFFFILNSKTFDFISFKSYVSTNYAHDFFSLLLQATPSAKTEYRI